MTDDGDQRSGSKVKGERGKGERRGKMDDGRRMTEVGSQRSEVG
jgi:hypothetical protein